MSWEIGAAPSNNAMQLKGRHSDLRWAWDGPPNDESDSEPLAQ